MFLAKLSILGKANHQTKQHLLPQIGEQMERLRYQPNLARYQINKDCFAANFLAFAKMINRQRDAEFAFCLGRARGICRHLKRV